MLYGYLDPVTAELRNIDSRYGVGLGVNDVEVVTAPSTDGPYVYDAPNKLAVSSASLASTLAKTRAAALISNMTQEQVLLTVAALLVMRDEINLLRQRDVDRAADVAASISLANLQTKWAARPALGQRSIQDAKDALSAKVNP